MLLRFESVIKVGLKELVSVILLLMIRQKRTKLLLAIEPKVASNDHKLRHQGEPEGCRSHGTP